MRIIFFLIRILSFRHFSKLNCERLQHTLGRDRSIDAEIGGNGNEHETNEYIKKKCHNLKS